VLATDVVVAELQRLPEGELHDLLRAWGEGRRPRAWSTGEPDGVLHLFPDRGQRGAQFGEYLGGGAISVEESEQGVLGADEAVAEQSGLLLGQHEDLPCRIGEALEHGSSLPRPLVARLSSLLRLALPGPASGKIPDEGPFSVRRLAMRVTIARPMQPWLAWNWRADE
jgi:hypothetical protein